MAFQKLYFDLKALDVDTSKRTVKYAFAELSKKDRDKDIIDKSAPVKSIKERGPQGTNEIWHLVDHTQSMFSALGKPMEIGIDKNYLYGVSRYKDSFLWREVAWPLYEAGDITQHSIGFETIKSTYSNTDQANIIQEMAVWEGSAVLWGANSDTPTMQVVKGLMNHVEDSELSAAEHIDKIIKRMKDGKYEEKDDLLFVELKRLQYLFDTKNIKSVFTQEATQPELKTTVPEERKRVEKEIQLLILKHFS